MAIKVLLGAVLLAFTGTGVVQLRSNYQRREQTLRGRVSSAVERAKANNKREITIPAPIPYYAAVKNLDDALSHYSTVVAKPILQHSQINPDSKEIETWYKLQIVEFLSEPQSARCTDCFASRDVPQQLQPVLEDEILMVRNTGTVVSEGVKVTSSDLIFPDLKLNQEYLLFVSIDLRTRVGVIELGATGVSTIDADGQISPVNAGRGQLSNELKARYGKMDKIQVNLKSQRFSE